MSAVTDRFLKIADHACGPDAEAIRQTVVEINAQELRDQGLGDDGPQTPATVADSSAETPADSDEDHAKRGRSGH